MHKSGPFANVSSVMEVHNFAPFLEELVWTGLTGLTVTEFLLAIKENRLHC